MLSGIKLLDKMREKISKPSFETWMKATKAYTLKGDILTVIAPNEFNRDWLEDRYSDLIADLLFELTGEELEAKFITPPNQDDDEFNIPDTTKKVKKQDDEQHDFSQHMLNTKNTFDTFVIGSGNRFAHAASLAVAEAPAKPIILCLFMVALDWEKHI